MLELRWDWYRPLDEGEWFRLSIWPDEPGARQRPYAYTRERSVRITAAHLFPGQYRWQITVVRSADPTAPGIVRAVGPPSATRTFAIVRPSTVATVIAPRPRW